MVRLRSYVSHLFRSLNALIKIKVVGFHPTPDQGGLLVLSSSKMVRNSWEHHDERIDKELKNINELFSLSFIHVSVQPPPDKTLVLKRFNPIEMTISFLSDSIQLTHCKNEVSELKNSINTAFNLLNNIHIEAPNK